MGRSEVVKSVNGAVEKCDGGLLYFAAPCRYVMAQLIRQALVVFCVGFHVL